MHYEDQARRFNLLSGFLVGALIGTGLGLLASPTERVRLPSRRRRRSRRDELARQWARLGGRGGGRGGIGARFRGK